jgi:hypothetical protein
MKKDTSICFRASRDLHEALLKISKEDRRSLSSTIAIILSDYVTKRKVVTDEAKKEKRQFPREVLSVPAVINQPATDQVGIAAITEISLGGLKILLPKELEERLMLEGEGSRFEVVFNLPTTNKPIRLACESKCCIDHQDSVQIGASFIDADFQNYKALQAYLI